MKWFAAAIALSCALPLSEADGAEIGIYPHGSPTLNAISFTGEIVEGDALRLKSNISRLPSKKYTAIHLNSQALGQPVNWCRRKFGKWRSASHRGP
jgi:hypothetical protein